VRNSENQVSILEERRQSVRVDLADLLLDPAWMVFQVEYYRFFFRLAGYQASLAELGLESDGGSFEERLQRPN
jgi:hypothetical protein